MELASGLGVQVFPVGFETEEEGVLVIDQRGRLFLLRPAGAYYLGDTAEDAFRKRLSGTRLRNAEDLFTT